MPLVSESSLRYSMYSKKFAPIALPRLMILLNPSPRFWHNGSMSLSRFRSGPEPRSSLFGYPESPACSLKSNCVRNAGVSFSAKYFRSRGIDQINITGISPLNQAPGPSLCCFARDFRGSDNCNRAWIKNLFQRIVHNVYPDQSRTTLTYYSYNGC